MNMRVKGKGESHCNKTFFFKGMGRERGIRRDLSLILDGILDIFWSDVKVIPMVMKIVAKYI